MNTLTCAFQDVLEHIESAHSNAPHFPSHVSGDMMRIGSRPVRPIIVEVNTTTPHLDPPSPLIQMLERIGKAIGWIGASVGALSVIVGICGYLEDYSHNTMLGIEAGSRDTLSYIIAGGDVIIFSAYAALVSLISFLWGMPVIIWLIVPAIIIYILIWAYNSSAWDSESNVGGASKSTNEEKRWERLRALAKYSACASLLICQMWLLHYMVDLLGRGNFLAAGIPDREPFLSIATGDVNVTLPLYGLLVLETGLTVAATSYWHWKEIKHPREDRALVAYGTVALLSAVLVAGTCVGLPLVYGYLRHRNDYPLVSEFQPSEKAKNITIQTPACLIRQDTDSYFIYELFTRRLLRIRSDSLASIATDYPRSVLDGIEHYEEKEVEASENKLGTTEFNIQANMRYRVLVRPTHRPAQYGWSAVGQMKTAELIDLKEHRVWAEPWQADLGGKLMVAVARKSGERRFIVTLWKSPAE